MRRIFIAVAASAVAFAISAAPAHATHDSVCTPVNICVYGHQHLAEQTAETAEEAIADAQALGLEATMEVFGVVHQFYWYELRPPINDLPDPVCLTDTPVCVTGHRDFIRKVHQNAGDWALWIPFCPLITAFGGECLPLPPVPGQL